MGEKAPITFESEGELSDEIRNAVNRVNESAADDEALTPYINGVNQMHVFFQENYRKNVRLLETVQEMNAIIVMNASKIQLIARTTEGDHDSLSKLKTEYEEASRMVNFAHQSEIRSKQLLQNLRESLSQLAGQVQRGEAFSFGEDGSIFEMSQDVKNLTKERDDDAVKIQRLQDEIALHKAETDKVRAYVDELKVEAQRLEVGIGEKEKMLGGLEKENGEAREVMIEMKSRIPEMKQLLDSSIRRKTELQKGNQLKERQQYEALAAFTQMRDEAKTLREKGSRRTKQYNELRRISASRESRIDTAKQRLEEAESEHRHQTRELERTSKQLAESSQSYDATIEESQGLATQKAETRKVIRELRPQLIKLQFDTTKSDNDGEMKQREVRTTKLALGQKRKQKQEAEFDHKEVQNEVKTIKSETKHFKPTLEDQKDKLSILYQEIDQKRSEMHRVSANIQMSQDNAQLFVDENNSQLAELKELQQKSIKQSSMSDGLRDERNNYKRQLEMQEKENAEMAITNGQLELQVAELSEKWDSMLKEIAVSHFKIKYANKKMEKKEEMIQEIQANILTVERMISRLQAETQTLNHIIEDANHDHLQQEKERQLLANNHQIVLQELSQKNDTLERLRNQIRADEAFLKKCSQLYGEKVEEVGSLMTQLKALEDVTKQLEEKRDKLSQLEYVMHRTFTSLMVEKHKGVTLVHEFSIPRNVHRWNAIEAVDPGYVKNIKFRCGLSAKIDAAHRELIELRHEKEELGKQLAEMKRRSSEAHSRAYVAESIRVYKEDIARMDEELQKYEKMVEQGRPQVGTTRDKVTGARSSLTQRRGDAALVKNQIYNAKLATVSESDGSATPYFITESPLFNPSFGGGFSLKQSTTRRSAPASELKVGPTAPVSKSGNRRPGAMPLIQPVKGIKSPSRFYGRNLVLPAIPAPE